MLSLQKCLWIAAAIQLAMFLANFYLPFKLQYRKNISGLAPLIRQIFIHPRRPYIAGVVLLFSAITFAFAPELASGHGLGQFLAATLCLFWFIRIPLQFFYYDKQIRRANRLGDIAMTLALIFLAVTYGVAAFQIV